MVRNDRLLRLQPDDPSSEWIGAGGKPTTSREAMNPAADRAPVTLGTFIGYTRSRPNSKCNCPVFLNLACSAWSAELLTSGLSAHQDFSG
jgi:hypothetical protein